MLAVVTRPLVTGARADLVVIEALPGSDPIRSIVRRASASHVRAVIVDGREVLPRSASLARAAQLDGLPAAEEAPLAGALAEPVARALAGVGRRDAVALASAARADAG